MRRQHWKPEASQWRLEESREVGWDHRFIGDMQVSSAFDLVRLEAKRDETFSRHLGAMVGTTTSRQVLELESLAWAVLPSLELTGNVPRISVSPNLKSAGRHSRAFYGRT